MALAFSLSTHGTTILSMDIDDVAEGAELVFEGRVLEHNVQLNAAGIVVTFVTFQVNDVVKGDNPGTLLELKFTGGTLGGEVVDVSGLRIPRVDEQGIYFVESTSRDLINPLLGWSQGHYLIVNEEGERRVSTVNRQAVTDVMSYENVPRTIRRAPAIIDGDAGSAMGVVTDSRPFSFERALTVDEFKSRIREILE